MPDPNYSPQKAHEYYLRTRDLKGRAAAAAKPIPTGRTAAVRTKATVAKKAVAPPKTRAQHRREVEQQVAAFEQRIKRLRETLRALVEAAKARSGVKPTTPTKATAATAKKAAPAHLTSKQKADAAKRAKDYYEKNKDVTPDQQLANLKAKVAQLEIKIKAVKAEADRATAARKKRAGSVGASSKKNNGRRGQNGSS